MASPRGDRRATESSPAEIALALPDGQTGPAPRTPGGSRPSSVALPRGRPLLDCAPGRGRGGRVHGLGDRSAADAHRRSGSVRRADPASSRPFTAAGPRLGGPPRAWTPWPDGRARRHMPQRRRGWNGAGHAGSPGRSDARGRSRLHRLRRGGCTGPGARTRPRAWIAERLPHPCAFSLAFDTARHQGDLESTPDGGQASVASPCTGARCAPTARGRRTERRGFPGYSQQPRLGAVTGFQGLSGSRSASGYTCRSPRSSPSSGGFVP